MIINIECGELEICCNKLKFENIEDYLHNFGYENETIKYGSIE
jgi:hypothetical protein